MFLIFKKTCRVSKPRVWMFSDVLSPDALCFDVGLLIAAVRECGAGTDRQRAVTEGCHVVMLQNKLIWCHPKVAESLQFPTSLALAWGTQQLPNQRVCDSLSEFSSSSAALALHAAVVSYPPSVPSYVEQQSRSEWDKVWSEQSLQFHCNTSPRMSRSPLEHCQQWMHSQGHFGKGRFVAGKVDCICCQAGWKPKVFSKHIKINSNRCFWILIPSICGKTCRNHFYFMKQQGFSHN